MSVRKSSKKDINRLMPLFYEFVDEGGVAGLPFEYNKEVGRITVENMFDDHLITCLEIDGAVRGGLAGFIVPCPFNKTDKYFHELFFYVYKGYRQYSKHLLIETEKICKEIGVTKMIMVQPYDSNADILERFYHINGYKNLEKHYIKEVK